MNFANERMQDIWAEALPLFQLHYQEVGQPDMVLDPDYDRMKMMEDAGMVYILTARDEDRLVGYAAFIVQRHIHYKQSMVALNDIIWLHPDYRKGRLGMRLIQLSEVALTAKGATKIYYHVKLPPHDFGPLLEKLGYRFVERNFAKVIG